MLDALVYGERVAGSWLAGSTRFERTQDLPQQIPVVTARLMTLLRELKALLGKGGERIMTPLADPLI